MKCFTCNNIFSQEAKFCLNCGRDLGKPLAPQPKQSSSSASRPTNAYPHPMSLANWQDMKARKLKNSLLLVGLALLVPFVIWLVNGISFVEIIAAFIACTWSVLYVHRVSQKNYYTLPSARDESGEHRCIFCGGRGIYRKGVYNSSTVHSNCSKCQKRLFTDLM